MNISQMSRRGWRGYAVAIFAAGCAAAVRASLSGILGTHSPFVTFYPAVIIAVLYGGLLAGLLATVLSALLASLFWIGPSGGLVIDSPAVVLATAIFVVSGLIVCLLCEAMHSTHERAMLAAEAERERIEAALGHSEQRLRMAMEGAGAGAWTLDLQTQRVEHDAVCARLFGGPEATPADFTTAAQVMARMDTHDWANNEERLRLALESSGKFEAEFRVHWPNGTQRWLSAMGQVVRDDASEPVRVVGINIDITDRKRMEEQLKTARPSAEQARAEADHASRAGGHSLVTR